MRNFLVLKPYFLSEIESILGNKNYLLNRNIMKNDNLKVTDKLPSIFYLKSNNHGLTFTIKHTNVIQNLLITVIVLLINIMYIATSQRTEMIIKKLKINILKDFTTLY